MDLYTIKTKKYSWYRTEHEFSHVIDVSSEKDYREAMQCARSRNLPVYALGNGSNSFFGRKRVTSLILRNCLPESIEAREDGLIEVSSSTKLMKLLRYLYANGFDGPYNLASVPATIGGAVAMNAGTGRKEGIFIGQYLRSVIALHEGEKMELDVSKLQLGFRKSMFSEHQGYFILSALFEFPRRDFTENPITKRLNWAQAHQELKVPNCGSVWREADKRILGIAFRVFRRCPAYISAKSRIWIANKSENPKHIRRILWLVRGLHFLLRRRCEHEVRIVK